MEINVYDVLVFEDEHGNIYQDCVCSKELSATYVACNENEEDEYFTQIECNNFLVNLDTNGVIFNITTSKDYECSYGNKSYKLKEIWTRTDEDTFKKVWSE